MRGGEGEERVAGGAVWKAVQQAADDRADARDRDEEESDGQPRRAFECHESLESVHSMWMKKWVWVSARARGLTGPRPLSILKLCAALRKCGLREDESKGGGF